MNLFLLLIFIQSNLSAVAIVAYCALIGTHIIYSYLQLLFKAQLHTKRVQEKLEDSEWKSKDSINLVSVKFDIMHFVIVIFTITIVLTTLMSNGLDRSAMMIPMLALFIWSLYIDGRVMLWKNQ